MKYKETFQLGDIKTILRQIEDAQAIIETIDSYKDFKPIDVNDCAEITLYKPEREFNVQLLAYLEEKLKALRKDAGLIP